MITTKLETITKELAEKYLKFNPQNRNVRWQHVETLKQDILAGRFLTTHQGIAFGSDGNLIDGQHRLLAIAAAGREVKILVTRGVEPHVNGNLDLFAMDVIDNGKNRSAADQLNLMHGVANASRVVGAVRTIGDICFGTRVKGAMTVTRAVPLLSIFGKEIEAMIEIASSSKVANKTACIGVLAFASKIDNAVACEFMRAMATGEEIKSGDPVYAVREHVIAKGAGGDRTARLWFTEALANAFYNTMKGTTIRLLKAGSLGVDWMRSKQRGNVEKVRQILTGQ